MPEHLDSLTPQRARRRSGQRMTAAERKQAQEIFLRVLRNTANTRAACQAAGISRSIVYEWKEHNIEFGILFQEANEEANDLIRAALWRRGVEGVETHVVSMGKVVYHEGQPLKEREYSDSLLALLAKARMPEFRDKGQTLTVVLPKEYVNVPEDGVDTE